MSAVLATTGLSVRFGGVHAVEEVDVVVEEGQLVGLIGPNGAGKTTFVDAITGFVRYTGRVELDGRDLAGMPPHARARRGLARTWQSTELFDDLTRAGEPHRGRRAARRSWRSRPSWSAGGAGRERRAATRSSCSTSGSIADAMPAELTQGQRKLVGVARAIAMEPRLLCLDEPAAGLDTRESEDLGQRLRQIADAGTTTLLIDHDMGLVMKICDRIIVLEFGKVIAAGAPDEVRRDPARRDRRTSAAPRPRTAGRGSRRGEPAREAGSA